MVTEDRLFQLTTFVSFLLNNDKLKQDRVGLYGMPIPGNAYR